MREAPVCARSRVLGRVGVAALAVALLGGCSADVARFDAFSNPFASSRVSNDPTASIGRNANAAPVSPVTSSPITSAPLPAPGTRINSVPATVASATPVTGSFDGWSAQGGTPVVMAQGESVNTLSQRYGVPAAALLKVNGYNSAAQVQPGARLVVPVYNAGQRAVAAAPAPARQVASSTPLANGGTRNLAAQVPAARTVTAAPVVPKAQAERLKAEKAKIEAARVEAAKTAAAKARADQLAQAEALKAQKSAEARTKTAAVEAPKVDTTTKTASLPAQEPAAAAPGNGSPEFRWPARGRIIQGFKPGTNEGINIAVPEGTSVKAAEGGVVAYAGSELKGYGNLVLIRHPNGYVTAYAHNGELSVKRGEQVARGQTIAKSGKTGNVNSPQLHFEVRKGSTPVDPTRYLAGL